MEEYKRGEKMKGKNKKKAIVFGGAIIVSLIVIASYASFASEDASEKTVPVTSNLPHPIWGYAKYSGGSWAVGASVSVKSSSGTLTTTVGSDGSWQVDCGDPGPNWPDGTSFTVTITQNTGETYQGWHGSASGKVNGSQNNMGTITLNPPSPPNKPGKPSGPTSGKSNTDYTYTASATDPNGIDVKYGWDWGDGSAIEWSGWLSSGQTCSMSHKWGSKGSYDVKVKAMNKGSQEGSFSNPLTVYIDMEPPTAYIDSITPKTVNEGDEVSFEGHGDDTDGSVVAYNWRSSIDGQLSTAASFKTTSLSVGSHTIYFKVQDNDGLWSSEVHGSVTVVKKGGNLPPDTPGAPDGPAKGHVNESYTYSARTEDGNGDQIQYMFDWGDGTYSNWTELVDSGATIEMSHSWSEKGNYSVKVIAKDIHGAQSGWSNPTVVWVTIGNRAPIPDRPTGTSTGLHTGDSYTYHVNATDPDGDKIQYMWDWGDGTTSGWYDSPSASHRWSEKHTSYSIRVKVKDVRDDPSEELESDWSEPLVVSTPITFSLPPMLEAFISLLEGQPIFTVMLEFIAENFYNGATG